MDVLRARLAAGDAAYGRGDYPAAFAAVRRAAWREPAVSPPSC
ncbi:hypothetical protein ACIBEF_22275 [Micromonospora sp. NPDC050795]